jgi:hypothetical protein
MNDDELARVLWDRIAGAGCEPVRAILDAFATVRKNTSAAADRVWRTVADSYKRDIEHERVEAENVRLREALSATAEMLETLAMGLPSTNMLRARQAEGAALIARRALGEGGQP